MTEDSEKVNYVIALIESLDLADAISMKGFNLCECGTSAACVHIRRSMFTASRCALKFLDAMTIMAPVMVQLESPDASIREEAVGILKKKIDSIYKESLLIRSDINRVT